MNKLITMIQPFLQTQVIYVYEDNVKIDAVKVNYQNFVTKVVELAKQYKTGDVEIIGPQQYTKGLGNKILEEEMTKYGKNTIVITYKS